MVYSHVTLYVDLRNEEIIVLKQFVMSYKAKCTNSTIPRSTHFRNARETNEISVIVLYEVSKINVEFFNSDYSIRRYRLAIFQKISGGLRDFGEFPFFCVTNNSELNRD